MDESTIAVVAAGLSLFGALVTAGIATLTSVLLARANTVSERRRLCFALQQQFDSPAMFHHRFEAWKTIEEAALPTELSVRDLFDNHWDESISAVVHFFESLEQFCGQDLVDKDLAVTLFARPYTLWNDKLLARLQVDETSQYYLPWLTGIRAFGNRLPREAPVI